MDREKVIKGLECCKILFTKCYNGGCPYFENDGCKARLKGDALALLKAQEARVMTLDELRMHEVYWVEEEDVSRPWPIAMHHIRNGGLLDGPVYQDYMGDNYDAKEYGKKWRVWTSRPSDEVRRATPWKRCL